MQNRSLKHILVTGGSGFIGSNFIRYLLKNKSFEGQIINIDALTYAGNHENLDDISRQFPDRYQFFHGDIVDISTVKKVFSKYEIDTVVHFAAESHVDRSIQGPASFIQTNIIGTYNLLSVAKSHWLDQNGADASSKLFHHISTDEVFGSLGESGFFTEETAYDPRSPYSASKASSDHLVRAWSHTYGLPITLSNCSNNYGPFQFPEKLIPLMIQNMIESKPLPVYGDGSNIRDWLFIEDHCSAIWQIIQKSQNGTSYNIGGNNEWKNIDLVHSLCKVFAKKTDRPIEEVNSLITFVKDRPGHDQRYAIDSSSIKRDLGWEPEYDFITGLQITVDWYIEHQDWVERINSGEYKNWIETNYINR